MKIKLTNLAPVDFVKRLLFLCYQGAGREAGMGFLQARRGVTEEQVFQNVRTAGDYMFGGPGPCNERAERDAKNGEFYGDYIFGRMVKYGANIKDGVIELRDHVDPDYNGWLATYKDPQALVKATIDSFNRPEVSYEIVN